MTVSRLWATSVTGPAAVAAYSGPFLAGIAFKCLGPDIEWLLGYSMWACNSGESLAAGRKYCLYAEVAATGTQHLVTGSQVTSGTLTAGKWNDTLLATPIPLAIGTAYQACGGWNTTSGGGTGFPDTNTQFGTGGPYVSGLTSGNLFAYSDGTGGGTVGTQNPSFDGAQGQFGTAGTDPAANEPLQGSGQANFWITPITSDTAPAGYAGTYTLFPNNVIGNQSVAADLNVNYNVGTEFALSQSCTVQAIRMLSPAGATQLPDRASVWAVSGGGLTRTEIAAATLAAPSWSGAAGSGWVQANFSSPPVLAPGKYVVAVFNSAASGMGTGWNAKDSITGAWGTGDYASGVSNGPLSAPGLATASTCYDYNGSNPGAVPPYSAGTTEAGQSCFGQLPSGTAPGAPYLYAGPSQNYFVDVVVAVAPASAPGGSADGESSSRLLRKRWLW